MPLALLLGLVDDMKSLPAFDWFGPCVEPKDIVYIGLRDLDAEEKRTIRRLGIKAYTVDLVYLFLWIFTYYRVII